MLNVLAAVLDVCSSQVPFYALTQPFTYNVGTRIPTPQLDSQMGQDRSPSDFIEPNPLKGTVSQHLEVGVSMDHRPLVSDERRFLISPGGGGPAAYISKEPTDTEGVPKPVKGQEGTRSGKPRSDPDPLDSSREIERRATHAIGRKLAVRTGPMERKVLRPCQFFVLLRAESFH